MSPVSGAPPQTSPLPSNCKELVAEDDVLVRLMLADELRKSGFQVFEANHSYEAISILKSVPVDVVITDLHMRMAMEGLELARYVRAHHPDVPLLLSSAHALPITDCDYFDAFFVKPYDPQRIVTWISQRQPTNLDHKDSDVA
jgi:CheY-like chemotaxis protein